MGLFDWLTGKRIAAKPQPPPRAEILKVAGDDSPLVTYVQDGMHVITDRDTFDHQFGESALPNPGQRDLADLLPRLTRVRAVSGGMYRGEALESPVLLDTSETDALAALRRCFMIVEDPATFTRCACMGGPTLELFAGSDRLATIGLQHGKAIRWAGWKNDAALIDGQLLDTWLVDHGLDRKLLELLYQNPFPFTGGGFERDSERAMSTPEQRLFAVQIRRNLGDAEAAMAEAEQLVAEYSELGAAYTLRGAIRSDNGDLAGSIADYSSAIERGDARADVFFRRAVALDTIGRSDDAIADCTAAIALDPAYANAFNSRGLVRLKLGKLEAALEDLNAAAQLAPEWELPYLNRAYLALCRQDWDGAIADYTHLIDKMVARDKRDETLTLAQLFWNRAEAYRRKGYSAQEEADRREGLRRNPTLGPQ